MITIEASHINFGGGFSLLIELLDYLNKNSIPNIVYIFHKKVYVKLKNEHYNYTTLQVTTTLKTVIRYFERRNKVIYFSNLPPFVINKRSIVYFQNELILTSRKLVYNNLKLHIYYYWLKLFINNVDFVACQTDNIVNGLKQVGAKRVLKLPFYGSIQSNSLIEKKYTFCYICSGAPHKNVPRLLDAIKQVMKTHSITCVVTIQDSVENAYLLSMIHSINKEVGKEIIINKGLVTKNDVIEIYNLSRALVFPSLKESLGLPLIEANMCGIKVLSSNLSFSHEVLNSPIIFDPYDYKSIANTMELFIAGKYDGINQEVKVKNKIKELVNIVL